MANFDLASLMDETTKTANVFSDLAVKTVQNTTAQTDITNVLMQQAENARVAAEKVVQIEGETKMQTQKAALQVANTMGTNNQDAGYMIGKFADVIKEQQEVRMQLGKEITDKQNMSFVDNPLGYIYAQATVNGDIDRYKMAGSISDGAADAASKLHALTTQGVLTQNAIEQSTTQAGLDAKKIIEGHKYQMESGKIALEGLRTNLQGMQFAANATKESLGIMFQGNAAQNQAKQLEISYAHLQLARETFDINKQAKLDRMDQDGLISKYISKGMFNASGAVMNELQTREAVILYKSKRPDIMAYFASGMESYMADPTGKQMILSTSPYVASEMLGKRWVQGLNKPQQDVANYLVGQRKEYSTIALKDRVDPKDDSAMEVGFNTFIRKKLTDAAAQGGGRGFELYEPASIETVVKSNPNMAALPVYRDVLSKLSTAGVKLDNPSLVQGAVAAAVTKGTLSYNDALDLTKLYSSGVQTNNMARNWVATGLPMGTGYIIDGVNLANSESYAKSLNRTLASNRRTSPEFYPPVLGMR